MWKNLKYIVASMACEIAWRLVARDCSNRTEKAFFELSNSFKEESDEMDRILEK